MPLNFLQTLHRLLATADDSPSAIAALDVFTDDKCTNYAAKTIIAPAEEDDYVSGTNTCLSVKAHGAQWGSVRQNYR